MCLEHECLTKVHYFNVVGLCPHISKAPTIHHMGELLVASHPPPPSPYEVISEFFDLLNLCWTSNFCKFDGLFFDFPSKVEIPIGSPLDSLISEIFEKDLFSFPLVSSTV